MSKEYLSDTEWEWLDDEDSDDDWPEDQDDDWQDSDDPDDYLATFPVYPNDNYDILEAKPTHWQRFKMWIDEMKYRLADWWYNLLHPGYDDFPF